MIRSIMESIRMSDVISLREEEVIKLSRRNRRKIWERES
jgi:hypothetical protein